MSRMRSDRKRGNGSQLTLSRFRLDFGDNNLYCEGGEALAPIAQRNWAAPSLEVFPASSKDFWELQELLGSLFILSYIAFVEVLNLNTARTWTEPQLKIFLTSITGIFASNN